MRVVAALLLFGMILHLATFWPGIMTWDAIRQYGQAVSGEYDDWHPPAMNWLWRQLRGIANGPAPMLVVQVLLYWGGTALLLRAALRRCQSRRRWIGAAAIALLALNPIALVLVGSILKDSLFAGTLLLAAGMLAVATPGQAWLRVSAGALLVVAATLRFNAVPACLPVLVALAPTAWRRTLPRLAATAVLAAVPLVLALPLANAALHAKRSGVELSLVIYDLGGIGRFSRSDAFPPPTDANAVAINRACYTAVSWDRYAWWGADPCPIGFATLRAPLATQHGPYGWWAAAVRAHPSAYLAHRLAHFDRNTRFIVKDGDLPGLSLASDPNRWGYTLAPDRLRSTVASLATAALATPIGWPACWIALALGLVVLRPSLREGDVASALAWSALLYALSYLPLSVASEVRYHLWTIVATGIAAALLLIERATWTVPRWRLVLAVVPFAATLGASIAARAL